MLKKNLWKKTIIFLVAALLLLQQMALLPVSAVEFEDGIEENFVDSGLSQEPVVEIENSITSAEDTPNEDEILFDDGQEKELSEFDDTELLGADPLNEESDIYTAELKAADLNNYTGYFVGELTNADYIGNEKASVEIDRIPYEISDDFDMGKATRIWVESIDKIVICEFQNGVIQRLDRVSDILQPSLSIKPVSADSLIYTNGEYLEQQIKVEVLLENKVKQNAGYDQAQLIGAKGIPLNIEEFFLRIEGDGLNFGNNNENKTKSETGLSVALGKTKKYTYTLYPDKGYVPTEAKVKIPMEGTAIYKKGKESVFCNQKIFVEMENLDLTFHKLNSTNLQKELKATKKSMDNCSAIALDANLYNYFSNNQVKEIERYLTIWIGEAIQAECFKPDSFTETYQKEVMKKILDKLGVSINPLLLVRTMNGKTKVKGMTKSYGDRTIEFQVTATSYGFTEGATGWGSTGKITYKITNSDGISGVPINGDGMVTFTNIEEFCNGLGRIADKSINGAYSELWGKNADKAAALFVETPFGEYLSGKLSSGNIYELGTGAVKKTVKKTNIKCPVDVYAYDWDGRLCGSIINNEVFSEGQDVYMTVTGDEKTVYYYDDDYIIRLVGNDIGTMEYSVVEYENEIPVRTVRTGGIPLYGGKEYYGLIPGRKVNDNSLYALTADNNQEIGVAFDTNPGNTHVDEKHMTGKCGTNVTYTYDYNGVLRIQGAGRMDDFKALPGSEGESLRTNAPWENFKNEIKNVIIEAGVTYVGDYAFAKCRNLQYAEISDTVQEVGAWAFWRCSQMSGIYIGKNTTKIGLWAFSYCELLQHVAVHKENPVFVMKNNVLFTKDGRTLCRYFNNGELEYAVPEGITIIGEDAFGNSRLEKITLPSSVSVISASAFSDNAYLSEVVLGTAVTKIQSYAFSNCENLRRITVTENVTEIGNMAFENCINLESVILPEALEKTGSDIFSGCSKLSSAGGLNSDCHIQFKWKNIPEKIFSSNKNLIHVEIPGYVKKVGTRAFSNCYNLETIEFPDSAVEVGYGAFGGCKNLVTVRIPCPETTLSDTAFSESKDFTMYGYQDSDAEIYAKKNNLEFISLSKVGKPELRGLTEAYNSLTISWKVQKGMDGYAVFRKTDDSAWKKLATVKPSVTKYKDTKVKAGYTYAYTVKAYWKENGKIQYSTYDLKGKKGQLTTTLKITSPKKNQAVLTWKKTVGASGYYVYRADFSEYGPYKKIKTIQSGSKLTYTDTKLIGDGTYYYKVAPYRIINNKKIEGSASAFQKIKIRPKSVIINLNRTGLSMKKNTSFQMKATVDPVKYQNTVKWVSSNPKVATVSAKGLVKAKSKGTAIIYAIGTQNSSVSCTVYVGYAGTKFAFAKPSITMYQESFNSGKPYALKEIDTTSAIKWKSKDEHIAVVKDGIVYQGGSRGVTQITAEKGGKTISCYVIVLYSGSELKTGAYGQRCSWEFTDMDKNYPILYIFADGPMPDVASKAGIYDGKEHFKYTPWDKQGLTKKVQFIEVDDKVTAIGARAFYGMSNLTHCRIPKCVQRVGAEAFANCSNVDVLIFYSSLKNVGDKAFDGCKQVHFNGKPPKFEGYPFSKDKPIKVTYREKYEKEWKAIMGNFSSNVEWGVWNNAVPE